MNIIERHTPVYAAAKDGSGSAGAQASSKAAKEAQSIGQREVADLPTTEQTFVFESMAKTPNWIDPNWAGFDRGPALQLPDVLIPQGHEPYTTKVARVGDTVVFTPAKGGMPAKFTVIPGLPDPESGVGTKRMPQVTNASIEDQLKTGTMTPDDLGTDAAAQVIQRSPGMRSLIEEGKNAPEPVAVQDVVKTWSD